MVAPGTSVALPRLRSLRTRSLPRPLLPRFGLRARLAIVFSIGALVVSSLLALVTWTLASGYMLQQRESGAVRQASANATAVVTAALTAPDSVRSVLDGLAARPYSAALLQRDGVWVSSGSVLAQDLPPRFLALAQEGTVRQRVVINDVPRLLVGKPVFGGGTYVEVFPLVELDRIFRFLSATLVSTTLVLALLAFSAGRWVTRLALQPLRELSVAARSVAEGDLRVRLDAAHDPDLAALTASFNEMAASLERRIARDARFTSDVSHELRSPVMTMVNAMAVLQRRREEMPKGARAAVDLLTADVERFSRMVTDLLEISRADQGQALQHREPVDLAELVARSCVGEPAPVEVDAPEGPVIVYGDRRRLERIVANLLENARNYGGGARRVGVRPVDGVARIEVDDDGPGVAPAERERIFERFARGGERHRGVTDTGTGLGLALVLEHTRLHDGRVWVESSPSGGARFVVELPLASR